MNTREKEDALTLGILQNIEENEQVTQRCLADSLGVALGLANAYLRRCVKKGLIKIHQAPANRYLYYLTPKGFSEKSRLTGEYLSTSFNYYRDASASINQIYKHCEENNWHRILFCGVSELAEIASIRAQENNNIQIIGTWDTKYKNKLFLHLPVWNSLKEVNEFDACFITSLNNTEKIIIELASEINQELILIPSILGIKRTSVI